MTGIYVFSQNLKPESLSRLQKTGEQFSENVFITTHMLFDYEQQYIESLFSNCVFVYFGEILSDDENEECDFKAYSGGISVEEYYRRIKRLKNEMIVELIDLNYPEHRGFLCSDDLGIDEKVWTKNGYEPVRLDYYYDHAPEKSGLARSVKTLLKKNRAVRKCLAYVKQKRAQRSVTDEVYVARLDGKKYVFIGKLSRVAYRMGLNFVKSEEDYVNLKRGIFEPADRCQYLSSLHESGKCIVPNKPQYDVRYIQDGYLPPNYSSLYLKFKPGNVSYYAWDEMGERTFQQFDIPVSIMPFRKKLYLPRITFRERVKTILVATSGPGDWTAQKNRSDEDLMLQAFVEVARRLPEIRIIYRCHPTWTHPEHAGINSIARATEYVKNSGLSNIMISSNIPVEDQDAFVLSFSRSSLEEDLKEADMVFGEHSVSMIDGALKGLPFASVNLTERRDLFCGLTQMRFPHCRSVKDIVDVIAAYSDPAFQTKFNNSVDEYNAMTDREDIDELKQ